MSTIRNDWTGAQLADGRYHVLNRLGRGGMGTVYKARDSRLEADVVIKVPHGAMLDDPAFVARFQAEILTLAKLSHPQIVKVMDVDRFEGVPYYVMQYLPGGSLEDRRRSAPEPNGFVATLDPRDTSRWLPGIASALDYLHERGYVHRDVKPANILFDDQAHPFLSDFGVIKVLSSAEVATGRAAQTGAGMVLGTAEYMAPEQVMGEAVDGRADQYALAVSVYETLAGRRPFEDVTKTKLFVMQIKDAPPPLEQFGPWIPAEVSRAVLKGLAKNREDRYPTCAAMAQAIGEAIAASLEGKPERVRFRCPSCGKSMSISSENFEKLRRSGRDVPCAACSTVIRGTGTVGMPWDGSGSGTLSISTSSFSIEPVRSGTLVERQGTLIERASTLIESGGTLQERQGTLIERQGTLIERAGTQLEPALVGLAPGTPPVPEQPEVTRRTLPVPILAGVGALVLLIGIGVGVVVFRPRSAEPVVPAVAVGPAPAVSPAPEATPPPEPEARVAAPAAAPPKVEPKPKPEPKVVAAVTRTVDRVEPVADAEPEPAPVRKKTFERVKTPQFLKDVRTAPNRFQGKEVELRHLYLLADVGRTRSGGRTRRTLRIAEPDLNIHAQNGLVGAAPKKGTEVVLDIHPDLASQLDAMPRASAIENLAVPTLQVDREEGESEARMMVIRLEFLKSYRPNVYKGGYKGDLRLTYETLKIEPGNAQEATGDRELWTKNERLGFLETRLSKTYDRSKFLQFKSISLSIAAAQNAIATRAAQAEINRQKALQEAAKRFSSGR